MKQTKTAAECDCNPTYPNGERIHDLTCSLFDGKPLVAPKTVASASAEQGQWAIFNRFEFLMPSEAINDCHHQGRCDDDVEHWAQKFTRPDDISADDVRAELKEYGAWDAEELADDEANWRRLLWIAAGNIQDQS